VALAPSTAVSTLGRRILVACVLGFGALVPLLPTNDLKASATLLMLVGFSLGLYAYVRTGGQVRPTPLDVPALTFLAVCAFATVFSVNPFVSFVPNPIRGEGLPIYVAYVAVALTATQFTVREIRTFVNLLLTCAAVTSLIAVGQYYGLSLARWAGWVGLEFGPRGWGTLANPILLGGYLCLVLPLAIVVAVGTPGRRWWIAAALCGVLYAALLASETRAAWVPLVLVAPALVWFLRGGNRTGRMLVLAALFAAVTAVMVPTQPKIALGSRALSSFDPADRSLEQKMYIWTHVLPLIEERPVFGWGFNNLAGRLPGAGSPEYERLFGSVVVDIAHNDVLQYAFSVGLAGLAAYLWIWFVTLRACARTIRSRTFVGTVRLDVGLAAGLAAYLVWVQFGWTHIGPANVFWVLAGIATALASLAGPASRAWNTNGDGRGPAPV